MRINPTCAEACGYMERLRRRGTWRQALLPASLGRFVRYGFPSAFFALSAFYLLIQNYFTHHPADDAARGPIAWRLEKL